MPAEPGKPWATWRRAHRFRAGSDLRQRSVFGLGPPQPGNAWTRLGDLAAALAEFDSALQVDPEHLATYVNRGLARKEAGDLAALSLI